MKSIAKSKPVVAIAGGSGFLGSHLVRRLGSAGYRIKILVRSAEKARTMESSADEIVVGSIDQKEPLLALCSGADYCINLVSNFRALGDDASQARQTNVVGALMLLEVASKAGIKRFIHTSTIGVHGDVKSTPADESSPFNPGDDYQITKAEAERAVMDFLRKGSPMDVVVVRPTSIYGPDDLRMLKLFRMLQKGRFVKMGPCQSNFHAVFVDDLCEGYRLCLECPEAANEIFILGGDSYLPLEKYLETAAQALNVSPPSIRVPYLPMEWLGSLCELMCRPLGLSPPLSRRRVRFFKNNRAFSITKARKVLGYEPQVDLLSGMKRTVSSYKEQGLLE